MFHWTGFTWIFQKTGNQHQLPAPDMADCITQYLAGGRAAGAQILDNLQAFLDQGIVTDLKKAFPTHTTLCLKMLDAIASNDDAKYKEKLVAEGIVDLLVPFVATTKSFKDRPLAVSCLTSISESVWTRGAISETVKRLYPENYLVWVNTVNLSPFTGDEIDDFAELLLNTDLVPDYKPEPPGKHWYDPKEFPALAILEENFELIKKEAFQLKDHQEKLIPWPEKFIAADGQWDILGLYAFENRLDKLCAICPETTKLLETIPGLQTALFSCLRPRAHIKPHIGYYQYSEKILRVHLGLIVPEGCRLKVNGVEHPWEEGKLIVFDDTYRHEAWNPSYDTTRVVLMFDILVGTDHAKPEYRNPEFCEKSKKQLELGEQALISGDLLSAISDLVGAPENVSQRPEKYL